MGGRYDLTDFEWSVIEPLLPNKPRGVPRVDDKRVLNGIFWVLRSGAPWRDLPERYGPYQFVQLKSSNHKRTRPITRLLYFLPSGGRCRAI